MTGEGLAVRPHHGLCIRRFTGKGYSPGFVENMARVVESLRAEPGREIRLSAGADILCGSCPHHLDSGCTSGQKVLDYDAAVLKLCGLADGTTLRWSAFQRLVEERILSAGLLETVCRECQWLELCRGLHTPERNIRSL